MSIFFPPNPTIGEIFTYQGSSWEWNGTFWQTYTFPSSGLTGSTSVGVGDSLISGIVDNVLELKSLSGNGITITDDGDTILLESDSSGDYLPLSGGTVTGVTIFNEIVYVNNDFYVDSVYAINYYGLPSFPNTYVTGFSLSNDVITLTQNSNDVYSSFTISLSAYTGNTSGEYLPISGGTVTGGTNFTSGLTANTISATTYDNLPVSGITEGTNIGVTAANGNFTISFTGTVGSDFTGGTVTGATNFTDGLTANTISATTYQNLPSQSGTGVNALSYSQTTGRLTLTKNDTATLTAGTFTYLTGISYSNNVITSTNNLGSSSTLTINSVTGLTINGNLSVTGTTSSGTISATTYQNLPLRVSGTGTQDYVTKWDSTGNGITNSQIYDTSGFIGINAVIPTYSEAVSIQTSNKGITIDGLYIRDDSNGSLSFAVGSDYSTWGTSGNEIAIGTKSPLFNSTGNNNIAIGRSALEGNTTGARNIAIGGDGTLRTNDSGDRNIAIGYLTMNTNYDGSQNVAIGDVSLGQNVNGGNNTMVGYAAGNATNSDNNTFIGFNAGTNNSSGFENTSIGALSLIYNTTGRYNVAIGYGALYSNDANDNVAIGHNAGQLNITGYSNVIIGKDAAINNDGSNNIFIGYNVANSDTLSDNKLNIGDTIFGDVSSKLVGINQPSPVTTLDVSGTTNISGGLTASSISSTGVTTLGNGTFTKAGSASGDIRLDNGATDTPALLMYYANNTNWGIDSNNQSFGVLSGQLLRFVGNLNEVGGAVRAAMDTTGNLVTNGFVLPSAYRPGQTILDTMLSNTQVTVSTTTIATSTSDTDFVTYSYTPTSSSSYLIIHYHLGDYSFASGTGNDSYISRIKVDGSEITYSKQSTVNGNRSPVLFPLTGRYTNSNTTAKSIVVACRRDSADDSITITNSSTSMWLRITEIAR